MTLNGTVHTVREGDVIYMPAGAEVSFVNGNSVTRVLQVFAGPSPASKYEGWTSVTPRLKLKVQQNSPIRLYPHLMISPVSKSSGKFFRPASRFFQALLVVVLIRKRGIRLFDLLDIRNPVPSAQSNRSV